jgi:Zn finger protein HypA/HybF involved in hydrogenase expression
VDDTMLDGNAVAGLLQDVFVMETTTAMMTCAGCGAPTPMGATHVFRGAGFVLRCPQCDNAMVTLVQGDGRLVLGFPGIRTLQVPVDGS